MISTARKRRRSGAVADRSGAVWALSLVPGSRPEVVLATVLVVVMGAVVIGGARPAGATWSIVATDAETGQVGAAIASCVPVDVLGDDGQPIVPVVLIPGEVAGVTQAALNVEAPARIRELVAADATPGEIVDDLMSADFDEVADLRQHAIVGLDGTAAAVTGAETLSVALDETAIGVSVQGNLLVSEAVVADTLARYQQARLDGADLATGLVAGLEAGSEAGGDRRCGAQTALFAQVAVAERGDTADAPSFLLTVSVDEGDGTNPVAILADTFEAGGTGAIDAGGAEASSADLFRIIVLVVAAGAVVVAIIVFRRGLGSIAARR